MRRTLVTAAAVAAVSVFALLTSPPAAQAETWPWCADLAGEDGGGGTNCGFASWKQCQETISGIGGWCYPNPHYRAQAAPKRRDRRDR